MRSRCSIQSETKIHRRNTAIYRYSQGSAGNELQILMRDAGKGRPGQKLSHEASPKTRARPHSRLAGELLSDRLNRIRKGSEVSSVRDASGVCGWQVVNA